MKRNSPTGIPSDHITPDESGNEVHKETCEHANKLFDALRWFFMEGIDVTIQTTATGYSCVFTVAKQKK
jgi:hypothetical protein